MATLGTCILRGLVACNLVCLVTLGGCGALFLATSCCRTGFVFTLPFTPVTCFSAGGGVVRWAAGFLVARGLVGAEAASTW
jgi:hypothetical protein